MLGIGKFAAGAEDCYLGIASGIEDYYVGIASPGQGIGSSQQLLGLTDEIQPDVFRAVFAGLAPTTGLALLNSANRTVMAFDLTFKADKSVSLLHLGESRGRGRGRSRVRRCGGVVDPVPRRDGGAHPART